MANKVNARSSNLEDSGENMNISVKPFIYHLQQADDSIVIMNDIESEELIHLKGVFADIYLIIADGPCTENQILEELKKNIEAPADVLAKDISNLIKELKEIKVLEVA